LESLAPSRVFPGNQSLADAQSWEDLTLEELP
jgi:hypothetical protein